MAPKYLQMMPFDYKSERIQRLKECTKTNQLFLNQIVQDFTSLFETERLPNGQQIMKPEKIKPSDVFKMRSTIKSMMREWSVQGKEERDNAFNPIIEEIESYFKEQSRPIFDQATGERISVLNPGCGLGRLVFEFAMRGYKA